VSLLPSHAGPYDRRGLSFRYVRNLGYIRAILLTGRFLGETAHAASIASLD